MKSRRLPWLLLALAATAALGALGEPNADVAVVASSQSPDRASRIRALLPRSAGAWQGGDPFAVAIAAPPAPAAESPAVAPARPAGSTLGVPTFPALSPWRVIGKQQDDDASWTVFLARGEDTWVVREGDTLDDGFRVAAIKPPTLTLQHIKHQTRRTLDIGIARE
jgi:hypothetical protein